MCGRLIGYAFATALAAYSEVPWSVSRPEQHGFDPARLDAARDRLAANNTRAFLVARHGRLVYEWYAPGVTAANLQGTASLAKAIVAGLPLMVALQDKRIAVDDLASKYIPRWRDHPLKSKITIRHLATHSSGIEDAEQDRIPHAGLPGWKGDFWKRKPDPISIALDQAPVIFEPGTRYHYSNPGMAALAYAVTAALRGAPQPDIRTVLGKRIFEPIGIPETDWAISYRESYELDGLRVYANWGGGSFTPRATARIGQLMLHKGRWIDRQVLRQDIVEQAIRYARTPLPERTEVEPRPASGLCWWTNEDGAWTGVPRDAFAGAGAQQQVLFVVPSLDLVVVRNGGALDPANFRDRFWGAALGFVLRPVIDAIVERESKPLYPSSSVIRGVKWAPASEILRQAMGSDNWPITWGDDDRVYTSYGDGTGFEPPVEKKLSLGMAAIEGMPPRIRAVNLRSEGVERTGDGRRGEKSSGLVMVDGVLYMWVRNTGNAQLVWSVDRGKTWQWGFKFDVSFGSPAFLNFGRNYAGARDGYVYTYSQDGGSAYEPSDGLLLARVPKDRVRDKAAYEFFVRLDGSGGTVWTRDIAQRGPVFSYPGRCERVDAVYNAPLDRYLLTVGYGHTGGWGIFDAPSPWGPWTIAYHTNDWGLGRTHGYRLPSKWISGDGRTMWLVFSGASSPEPNYDAFCVRRFDLEVSR